MSSSYWAMFVKIPICDSALIRYKRRDFGCNRSIIKVTVLEEQRTTHAVTWFPLEGLY